MRFLTCVPSGLFSGGGGGRIQLFQFLFILLYFVCDIAGMKQEVWVIHTVQCGMAGGSGI